VETALASHIPEIFGLDTWDLQEQLRAAASAIERAVTAAEMLERDDLPNRLRAGQLAPPSPTPEEVIEIGDVRCP
jgi:hypothetical protein